MKKNEIVNLQIENYGCNGEGVAKCNGEVVFVPYSLVGENIEGTVIKASKNFAIAKINNIKNESKQRICAPCPYFSKCGGCQLQHTNYENSLNIKTQIVQNAITNIGKIDFKVADTFASPNQYHYRNKISIPVNPKTRKLGMYRLSSHNIIDIDECLLQKDLISKLIKVFNDYLSITKCSVYDDETKKGLIKSLVAREIEQTLLVTVVINGDDLKDKQVLIDMLKQNFDNVGLSLNINKLKNNVILGDIFIDVYGNNQIDIEENKIKYSISNRSFLQVNDQIKNIMYQKIFEEIENGVVIDAYSGAGLLSAMMAKHAKFVYGIEIVEEATKLAEKLKENNLIQNLKNINGDCAIELPNLLNTLSRQDKENLTIVVDPPRKGCDKKVIEAIADAEPKKIIYMSCDPSTLARDLNVLLSLKAYKINSIEPFDMFPQTKHVETLVILKKNK